MTLQKAVQASPDLRKEMSEDPAVQSLIETAQRLEGLPRHAGTHAAGVVISKEPMEHYLPLQKSPDGFIITQFAKDDVEAIGLLKMDFLGLRTLTVINKTIENIHQRHGINIDFKAIDENDPLTYEMLSRGDSSGVFQLESSGLRAVMRELKPSSLEDVIALTALYRPGPLGSGMAKDFIDCKHGLKEIEYPHPMLEDILKPTYGVILYQEQVMQIVSKMAGFSLGEADMLRRAIGKKKPEILEGFRSQFINGAADSGVAEETAAQIFSLIEYFGGYGFNKSHSAAYGLLAFQTAWLKCHYPAEFMAQLLNSFIDNSDRITFYVKECRTLGIEVLPPDVNESGLDFTVTNEGIRFGLAAVKGVGENPVGAIIRAREEGGRFTGLQDFCLRVDTSEGLNKRVLENLILCGAMSSFGHGKRSLQVVADECLAQGIALQKSRNSNQISFFDVFADAMEAPAAAIEIPEVEDFSETESLKFEKALLGIYVSGHPLDAHQKRLNRQITTSTERIKEQDDGKKVTLGGILSGIRFQTTKKGELMAYAQLEDVGGTIELLIFPRTLSTVRSQLEEEAVVLVSGRLQLAEEERKLFVEDIRPPAQTEATPADVVAAPVEMGQSLQTQAKNANQSMYIQVQDTAMEAPIFETLAQFPGETPVYMYYPSTRRMVLLDAQYWLKDVAAVQATLANLLGERNISVKTNN